MQIPLDTQSPAAMGGQEWLGPQGVLWGDVGPVNPSPCHTLCCSARPRWTRGTGHQPEHTQMVFPPTGDPALHIHSLAPRVLCTRYS